MPKIYAQIKAKINCVSIESAKCDRLGICERVIICMTATVRKIAIGSFEPLSSSKSGAMLFLSRKPLLRIMAKTAAASVELIIAPKSSEFSHEIPSK